jgi:TolB protein
MFFTRFRELSFYLRFLSLFIIILLSGCDIYLPQSDVISFLYLAGDENEKTQLFRFVETGPQKLTDFESGVHDYALSPNGRNLILSTINNSGHSELWLAEDDGSEQVMLYSCPQAECSNFTWAPDSRRLLFERRELVDKDVTGSPFLWWLDTQTAEVLPLQASDKLHGASGRLSPDGQWVSYFSPEDEGIYIYNLETGSSQFVINEIGADVAWSPDGKQLVVPQLDLVILHSEEGDDHQTHAHDYQTAVHLLLLDVISGEQKIISGDLPVEDSVPAWSPDGNWIAFGRRATGAGAPRQLWIVHPDGTGARALTDDPAINYGPPMWTSDGRYLIFQQIPQQDLSSHPSIWRIDIETGEKQELIPSGMLPTWLSKSD